MAAPLHPHKANSVRSNASDTQSLKDFNNKRQLPNRKFRQSVDLTQSIDCNNNEPLKPRDQNEPIGETIQYPAASKMREMLSTDSNTPMEKPTGERCGQVTNCKLYNKLYLSKINRQFASYFNLCESGHVKKHM